MEIVNRYKYFIIAGVVLCTILGIIVYNSITNSEETEYESVEKNESENITITKEDKNKIKVHISGEVINPGVIEIEEGSRIIDAVNMSGGLTEEADLTRINLAYILDDAMKVHIPNINDEQIELTNNENQTKTMVNINTATAEELQKINGIGSSIAQKIVQYRKEHGKFTAIEELKNVGGIGESKYDSIKDNVYVK
jgi:competence protein ComEA